MEASLSHVYICRTVQKVSQFHFHFHSLPDWLAYMHIRAHIDYMHIAQLLCSRNANALL